MRLTTSRRPESGGGQTGIGLDDFTKTYTLYKRRSTNAFFTTMAWIEFLQGHYGN